jgi:hypothetical protein
MIRHARPGLTVIGQPRKLRIQDGDGLRSSFWGRYDQAYLRQSVLHRGAPSGSPIPGTRATALCSDAA